MVNLKIFFIVAFSAIFAVACQNNHTDNNNKIESTVTIATLKGPSAMSMVWLMDSLNHYDPDNNYNFIIKDEPMQIRKMMLQEEVDFAVLPTTMGAILYNKDIPYILAGIPVWGTLYLCGNDTSIQNWNDLKGKKVHLMAKGMTPDVMFQYLLKKNGVKPNKEVQLDYSFPTHIDLANAIASGYAKLGVISEPLVSLVMSKNQQVKPLMSMNDEWEKVHEYLPVAMTALLVKEDFAKNNKKIVDLFLKNYKHSTDWINENPDEAAERIVFYNILPDTSVAKESIPRSNIRFKEASVYKKEIIHYLNVFYKLDKKIIGGKKPDDKFYYKK